jgi:protein-tyrosine phosphatase
MAGPYPGDVDDKQSRQKLNWLLNQGVDFFLDLTESQEHGLVPYAGQLEEQANALGQSVDRVRLSIEDFTTPSKTEMTQILDTLDAAIEAGSVVYLHCFGGIGRTGTVVGCYLVRHGMSGEAALNRIVQLRKALPNWKKASPETKDQRNMILNWSNYSSH